MAIDLFQAGEEHLGRCVGSLPPALPVRGGKMYALVKKIV